MKNSLDLRVKIIETCRWLSDIGYVFGTWGNISVRLEDGSLLITPSKLDYTIMQPEDLVVMNINGSILSGHHLPTSERELHRGIMNKRKDIQAIIHTHSPYAMAMAAVEGGIPAISEEMCQLVGGAIPLTPLFVPSENHVELGEVVTEAIGERYAVLIRNHGPVCCGTSLDEAKVCTQVVEKAAQMFLAITRQDANIIEEKYVVAAKRYFRESYGKT